MKQSDKRLIRKVRRKARRAKVKTEIDRWRETVYAQLLDLDKRVSALEEVVDTALETKREHEVYREVDAERAAKP